MGWGGLNEAGVVVFRRERVCDGAGRAPPRAPGCSPIGTCPCHGRSTVGTPSAMHTVTNTAPQHHCRCTLARTLYRWLCRRMRSRSRQHTPSLGPNLGGPKLMCRSALGLVCELMSERAEGWQQQQQQQQQQQWRRRKCARVFAGAGRGWSAGMGASGTMVGLYVAPIGTLRIVGDHFDCAVKHHDLRPVPGQACGPPDLVHSTKAAQHTASAKYAKSHHIPGRASEPCPPL